MFVFVCVGWGGLGRHLGSWMLFFRQNSMSEHARAASTGKQKKELIDLLLSRCVTRPQRVFDWNPAIISPRKKVT